jgi:hypothetical protein
VCRIGARTFQLWYSRALLVAAACLVLPAWNLVGRPPGRTVQDAWIYEQPGGDTGCAFDTPFGFFHRGLSEASDLLIYFQGGGACWEWVSCSGLFDTDVSRDEVAGYSGIFDSANTANPFRSFAVVFVPYCTGDVHVGDTTRRYGEEESAVPVAHRGYRNVTAVLDWIETRIDPQRVVVAGASAGSYGALFYTPEIARRFARATTFMIGDSGVPLLHDYVDVLQRWGAAAVLRELWGSDDDLTASQLDLVAAHARASRGGSVGLAQITSDRDVVQSAFYLVSGSPGWREATYEILDDVEASVTGFHSFVVAGSDHGLLRTDRFYEYAAGGISLSDWIADFIDGKTVTTVQCDECTVR